VDVSYRSSSPVSPVVLLWAILLLNFLFRGPPPVIRWPPGVEVKGEIPGPWPRVT
jgi:hypothetical protein